VRYNLHHCISDSEFLEFIDLLQAGNQYLFPVAEHVKGGVHGPNSIQRMWITANKWTESSLLAAGGNRRVYLNQM
jgi:hypothetical protein